MTAIYYKRGFAGTAGVPVDTLVFPPNPGRIGIVFYRRASIPPLSIWFGTATRKIIRPSVPADFATDRYLYCDFGDDLRQEFWCNPGDLSFCIFYDIYK